MERNASPFTLPISKAVFYLYDYMTTRELRAIRREVLETTKIKPDMKEEDLEFNAASSQIIQDSALKFLVQKAVDANGNPIADPIDFIGNSRIQDGDYLYAQVNAVYNNSLHSEEDKKK